ncbi:MAG: glycosyltransferase, partial [Dehalococcoidia bacterium]
VTMLPMATRPLRRMAMLSVHGCPMALPGMRFAGGMNMYLKRIAPLIAEQGICVDIFTRSHHADGQEVVELGPHARVVHLPAGSPELVKEEVVSYLPDFLDGLQEFALREGLGYDLVYSHYWLSGWVGMHSATAWGVPHVACFHTVGGIKELAGASEEPPERKAIEAEIARTADRLFVFTEDEAQQMESLFGVPRERCDVIPGGVDLELFRPRGKAEARRRIGVSNADKMLLFVGRIEPFKGPDVLVRAAGAMQERDGLRLVFVGGSTDEQSDQLVLRTAAEEGLSEHITWHEAIPQDELVDYYSAADLCVVPSYHETFGFAALEAMACGTPVVAAKVGALPFLVRDGETGRLVEGHDPGEFARCLEGLLADPNGLARMGTAARERAAELPWSRTARETLRCCRLALDGFRERPMVLPCPG